nr:SWR1-complex protein 3-like [Ipomoea batatas]
MGTDLNTESAIKALQKSVKALELQFDKIETLSTTVSSLSITSHNHAIALANLEKLVKQLLTQAGANANISPGNPIHPPAAETSFVGTQSHNHLFQQQDSAMVAQSPGALGPSKAQLSPTKPPTKTTLSSDSMVKETAVVVGTCIATPSDVASLLKAAKSMNVVLIPPGGGDPVDKPPAVGANTLPRHNCRHLFMLWTLEDGYFPDQQREHDGYWTVVRTGANWPSRDTRELFYSFHRDEVPAESVMHKFQIASNILVFSSKEYDTEQMNLFKLTDKDYEDNKQPEIDLLVQKTFSRLGDLPDIVLEDAAAVQEDHFFKSKRLLRKKSIPSLDVSRKDDAPSRNGQFLKAKTPGSCVDTASEFFKILSDFNALTGEKHRDKWLEKLLQAIQFMSNPGGSGKDDAKEKGVSDVTDLTSKTSSSNPVNESNENKSNGDANICWPDTAVPAVVAVEKAAHEALSSDFQKYNQKMRQLSFNFKNNVQLAQRLLNGELEAYQILNMSPNELKEGLTAEEIARRKPDEQELIQMTDARCNRCTEKQVRLLEINQTRHGDRYQLECGPCGNTWYASRDEVATLTIQEQTARKNVGTEPLVTPKFDDREKLANAHTDEEEGNDVLKKTTEAGLDSQKSPDEARPKDNSAANNAE